LLVSCFNLRLLSKTKYEILRKVNIMTTSIMPAEWAPHDRVWIGFPSNPNYWSDQLAKAQLQIAAFANAVCDEGRGEAVYLIAGNAEAAEIARAAVHPAIHVEHRAIGDIWLRDTGCIITDLEGKNTARNFEFNGWGGRFNYPGDQTIGAELATAAGYEVRDSDWILEGGSIDVDGEGMAATTTDCLLNPNRNTLLNRDEIERRLLRDLGITRMLWLGDGLSNDHTDGHVDNLARFVAPGHLVIPLADSPDDPNISVYKDAHARAIAFGCKVTALPSVGLFAPDGEAVPASYANFYIGNTAVVVPQYGAPNDQKAVQTLQSIFPDRKVVGIDADAVLTGGGSFHCCSQQVPS
jgi:agmatine deiminase